jgi:hypothetical protein
MLKRNLILGVVSLALTAVLITEASAQDATPRFGRWQMDSDAPAPSINIMTYEPYGDGGMKITVASTNARGQDSEWGYVTMFDSEFHPVTGRDNADTSVEFVNAQTTRITNRSNGRVTQVIINTLSEDGNSIDNEYVRLDENGKITSVSHAVYRLIGR